MWSIPRRGRAIEVFCCGEQQKNRVYSDSEKKETTEETLGADVHHLGEAIMRGTRMRFCSTHYKSDFEPVLLSLAEFDSVKISVLRKRYMLDKKCDHKDGLNQCRQIPVYRIEISCEKFVEAMVV